MSQDPIVIVGMARTPMGGLLGDYASTSAAQLGSAAIKAALERAGLKGEDVDRAIIGNVLQAGQGQAPGRQAVLGAGVPNSVGCTTVNKMCGSGMEATIMAHDSLSAGSSDIIIAGGMESMTNAPYLLPKMRGGARVGHAEVKDHMFLDGLEDAYHKGSLMGHFAEATAEKYQFSREDQDNYALASLERAKVAIEKGYFKDEITAVTVKTRKGDVTYDTDEQPGKARPEKIPQLKPAFAKDGTVTAANASSISDGAAALILTRRSIAEEKGLTIIAEIKAHSTFAHQPEWFTTAPVGALKKIYEKTGWSDQDVDLYELNEAFAVVPMAAMRELGISHDKVNIHGGACALGHPIGASGTRILVTLINALKTHSKKRGVASLCIGGGEATAVALELA